MDDLDHRELRTNLAFGRLSAAIDSARFHSHDGKVSAVIFPFTQYGKYMVVEPFVPQDWPPQYGFQAFKNGRFVD